MYRNVKLNELYILRRVTILRMIVVLKRIDKISLSCMGLAGTEIRSWPRKCQCRPTNIRFHPPLFTDTHTQTKLQFNILERTMRTVGYGTHLFSFSAWDRKDLIKVWSDYLSSSFLSSRCRHLEHRASVKRCFTSFLNLRQSVGLLGQGVSPSKSRYLLRTTQTENKRRKTSMPWVAFEPTIPAFERAKICSALHRAATVIGSLIIIHHKPRLAVTCKCRLLYAQTREWREV
jgi:hypothetical protein